MVELFSYMACLYAKEELVQSSLNFKAKSSLRFCHLRSFPLRCLVDFVFYPVSLLFKLCTTR